MDQENPPAGQKSVKSHRRTFQVVAISQAQPDIKTGIGYVKLRSLRRLGNDNQDGQEGGQN
jgi:hypothetical protein